MTFDMNLEERDIIPLMFKAQKQVITDSCNITSTSIPNMNLLTEAYTEFATVQLADLINSLQEKYPSYSDMEATALVCNFEKLRCQISIDNKEDDQWHQENIDGYQELIEKQPYRKEELVSSMNNSYTTMFADFTSDHKSEFIDNCVDAGFKSRESLEKTWDYLYAARIN